MAKKGQPVQLQAEINNDEEWEKLLQRDGLIVVDVYSEWCGPCQGMAANLKKLKLEIGGDMLHLAIAKSDTVSPLQRFKNKSEPTWMLISKGKMVNLMFGANAPKLTSMIIEELKMEQEVISGEKNRETFWEITELSPVEQVRYEANENIAKIAREKEETKRNKEILERKTAECINILNNLSGYGVILILPNAKTKYQELLMDITHEAGLQITQTEKVKMSEEKLEELLFFSENEKAEEFNEDTLENLLSDESFMLLLKVHAGTEVEDIDDLILTLIYGSTKKPPGDNESIYKLLFDSVEDESTGEIRHLAGIWVPSNSNVRATALRLFFPKATKQYEIAEPEPTPPYISVIFEQSKINEALNVMNQFSSEILYYGFFTDENPEKAQLIAQSIRKLEDPENLHKRTFDERLVIQVAKRKSECIFALAQLQPIYMSPNVEEGKRECELFFPENYANALDEEDMNFERISIYSEKTEKEIDELTQEKNEAEKESIQAQSEEDVSIAASETVDHNVDNSIPEVENME